MITGRGIVPRPTGRVLNQIEGGMRHGIMETFEEKDEQMA